jgi:lysophospholipase L1-like esterase
MPAFPWLRPKRDSGSFLKENTMKTILCFGDSNTWGYIPGSAGERMPYESRWPGVLQAALGSGCRVLEEGLSGRMSAWEDPMKADRNGKAQLPALLESHRPVDLLTLMLGTNDMKSYMHLGPEDCALAQNALIDVVEAAACGPGGSRPVILLIAPPLIVASPALVGPLFDGGIAKSAGLAEAYRQVAALRNCLFLDAGRIARPSARDGLHLDPEGHRKLAEAVAPLVRSAVLTP